MLSVKESKRILESLGYESCELIGSTNNTLEFTAMLDTYYYVRMNFNEDKEVYIYDCVADEENYILIRKINLKEK